MRNIHVDVVGIGTVHFTVARSSLVNKEATIQDQMAGGQKGRDKRAVGQKGRGTGRPAFLTPLGHEG